MCEVKEKEKVLASSKEFNQFIDLVASSSEEEINHFIRERFRIEKGGCLFVDTKGGDKLILVGGEFYVAGKSILATLEGSDCLVSELSFHEIDDSIYGVLLQYIVNEKFDKNFPL